MRSRFDDLLSLVLGQAAAVPLERAAEVRGETRWSVRGYLPVDEALI
jgi:hypothetical protein